MNRYRVRASDLAILATFVVVMIGLTISTTANAVAESGFNPIAISFSSVRTGWVLGLDRCHSSQYCYALDRTTNGGRTWSPKPLPPLLQVPTALNNWYFDLPSQMTVTFANGRDGWIYGDVPTKFEYGDVSNAVTRLWSTTNGGSSWTAIHIARLDMKLGILDLVVDRGRALLAGTSMDGTVVVRTTRIGSNVWERMVTPRLEMPAGGTTFQGAFVVAGSTAWLIAGNDRGVTASARLGVDGKWRPWAPPCASSGYSYSVPVAIDSSRLVAQCAMGGYSFTLPKNAPKGATVGSQWLYTSSNGGSTFQASHEIRPMRSAPYFFSVTGLPAEPAPGDIFTSRPIGTNYVSTLIESTDSGETWRTVYSGDVLSVSFPSARFGVAIAQTSSTRSQLIRSRDGGQRWSVMSVPG